MTTRGSLYARGESQMFNRLAFIARRFHFPKEVA